MKTFQLVAIVLTFPALSSPALAETCGLCAKRVVVVPSTAPCLEAALLDGEIEERQFVKFDLSKCGAVLATRGIVPGLPSPQNLSERPTVQFVVPRSQIACLKERFAAAQTNLDPYAVIDLANCK